MTICNFSLANVGHGIGHRERLSQWFCSKADRSIVFDIFAPALTVFEIVTFEKFDLDKVSRLRSVTVRNGIIR